MIFPHVHQADLENELVKRTQLQNNLQLLPSF